jgi:hypothetical protein
MKYTKAEIELAKARLLEVLEPGDNVYCLLNHVSRSGMYRAIRLIKIKNGEPYDLSWHAAKLLEGYDKNHNACRASGCGMDMGFHLVYNLSYQLFGNGYALKQSWL